MAFTASLKRTGNLIFASQYALSTEPCISHPVTDENNLAPRRRGEAGDDESGPLASSKLL